MPKTFVRIEGIEVAPMRDESILFVPTTESYCVLNPSASVLWEALSEPVSEDSLARLLCEHFSGADVDAALKDVRETMRQMAEMALVQEVP